MPAAKVNESCSHIGNAKELFQAWVEGETAVSIEGSTTHSLLVQSLSGTAKPLSASSSRAISTMGPLARGKTSSFPLKRRRIRGGPLGEVQRSMCSIDAYGTHWPSQTPSAASRGFKVVSWAANKEKRGLLLERRPIISWAKGAYKTKQMHNKLMTSMCTIL